MCTANKILSNCRVYNIMTHLQLDNKDDVSWSVSMLTILKDKRKEK